jgi:hypothetical protein
VQRLHLVGFTSELDGLIFSARTGVRSGGFVVTLDAELLDAIRDVLERREGAAPAATAAPPPTGVGSRPFERPRPLPAQEGSALTPRDIQARLRAGRSISEVAFEAGVAEDWVRRFAPPVFAEQAHVVSRALVVVCEVDGEGPSVEPLGDAVATKLAERGVLLTADELAAGWSAFQVRGSSWAVQFRYRDQGTDLMAQWGFEVRSATLVPLNRLGAELGWVDGGQPKPSAFAAVGDVGKEQDGDPTGTSARPSVGDLAATARRLSETLAGQPVLAPRPKPRTRPSPSGTSSSPTGTSPPPTGTPAEEAPVRARRAARAAKAETVVDGAVVAPRPRGGASHQDPATPAAPASRRRRASAPPASSSRTRPADPPSTAERSAASPPRSEPGSRRGHGRAAADDGAPQAALGSSGAPAQGTLPFVAAQRVEQEPGRRPVPGAPLRPVRLVVRPPAGVPPDT